MHTHGAHTPVPVQLDRAPHGLGSHASPSAAQVSAVPDIPIAHRRAPGVHTRGRHVPIAQLSLAPHGVAVVPWPSALHTARAPIPAQLVAVPGVHVQRAHIPVPTHAFIAGHAAASKPSPSIAHTRRVFTSVHENPPGVHTRGRHAPIAQLSPAPQFIAM